MTETTPAVNEDVENPPSPREPNQVASSSGSGGRQTQASSTKVLCLAFVAIAAIVWGSVMTALYVREKQNNVTSNNIMEGVPSSEATPDTKLRSDGALGMAALSHINVVVNDTIDEGAAYYEMLGFYPASNKDGPMNYTNVTNYGFCVDAGFDSCRVDIIFLKHETINIYLELFFYYEPEGDRQIPIFNTNDAGGIRHIAVEVEDAVETYNDLKAKDHQGMVSNFCYYSTLMS